MLVGKHAFVPVNLEPPAGRRTDIQAQCQYDPALANDPQCANQGRGGRGGGGGGGRGAQPPSDRLTTRPGQRARQTRSSSRTRRRSGSTTPARPHGQISAFDNRSRDITKAVPTVVMRNEDYGRISRILAERHAGANSRRRSSTSTTPRERPSYNAIAEIAGSDKKDEVVMAGGHLDSWHSATGATDNAIGCTIMMEAARILKALGVQPRRTIRIALWSGEEQGLLGSQAYVKAHFGSAEDPLPEFAKFNGYLNIDSGTGRLRGASVFGPPGTAAVLREILAPFKDLKICGATETASRATGGTDSTSFNNAGLPGIGFGQDPIEYGSHTWHTNLDTYERVVEQDVRDAAVVVAATLYQLAMRDRPAAALRRRTRCRRRPRRGGGGGQ